MTERGGSRIAGANLLFGSEFNGFYRDFTEIAFSTGSLNMDADKQYVVYFSAASPFDGMADGVYIGTNNFQNSCGPCSLVYDNCGTAAPCASWNRCRSG